MSVHLLLDLEWLDPLPSPREVERLNKMLHLVDYDAPRLGERGALGALWRKPLVLLEHAAAMLHALGHPVRYRDAGDADAVVEAHDAAEGWQAWWRAWYRAPLAEIERRALDAAPWHLSDPAALRSLPAWKVEQMRGRSRALDRWLPPRDRDDDRCGGRRGGRRRKRAGSRWRRERACRV